MEKELLDVSLEEEFVLANFFTPLIGLPPVEFFVEFERILEQQPIIPEVALYAIVQIRILAGDLLKKLPEEKRTPKASMVMLKNSFQIVMRNKVSSVLKRLNTF